MSLKKRGDVWHYDFTVNGERYRGSTQQLSKTAARKVEERERERAALGRSHQAIPTLQQAAAQWFRSRAEGRKSVVTIAQRVKIMLPLIGPDKLVTEIGTADVEAAIQARRLATTRQGRATSNSTANRDVIDTTLRPILRYCAKVLELPVKDIAWGDVRLTEPKRRVRSFTAAEIIAWRAALPEWHRPVFDFMALYGVRLKEAFFSPDALDVEAGEVTIRSRKNEVDLTIPLLEEDVRDFAARASRARAAGLTSIWYREGRHGLSAVHWRGFQSASKAAQLRVGITGARPAHDLRHHAATKVRRSGDVLVVQMLLGHEDLKSTARYAQADKSDVLKALRHARGANVSEASESPTISNTGTGT